MGIRFDAGCLRCRWAAWNEWRTWIPAGRRRCRAEGAPGGDRDGGYGGRVHKMSFREWAGWPEARTGIDSYRGSIGLAGRPANCCYCTRKRRAMPAKRCGAPPLRATGRTAFFAPLGANRGQAWGMAGANPLRVASRGHAVSRDRPAASSLPDWGGPSPFVGCSQEHEDGV